MAKPEKQLITCQSLVSSADKFGLLSYRALDCKHLHHKWWIFPLRTGGPMRVRGAWSIWKHRNSCVFDGVTPNLPSVVATIQEEMHQWSVAGAQGVSHLLALAAPAS